ncbi:MAG: Hsp20/alpha crystallin family protein [Rhodospirillales bacterium]|nr:Hsp20/alpha crystallin family protein [Rhodospirillales bacterium]
MTDSVNRKAASGETGAESTRNVPVFRPAADIYETKDALVLVLEMPNVDPGDIDVTLDKRVLTVLGRGKSIVPEGYALSQAEYRDGDYERSFTLPEAIDADGIAATVKDGVLSLNLPKSKPAPAKTISVKTG